MPFRPYFLRPNWHRWLPGVFFGLLVLLGVALHRDYGVGWDEQLDRLTGIVNAKYVALRLAPELARRQATFNEIPDLHDYADVDHGVLFQLPLVVLEKVVGADDSRDVYFLRHLLTWLICVAGTYALYRVARRYLGGVGWGLVVAAALVLSPRFFAESFYNYKDLVFVGFFTLGIGTLRRWLRRPTWPRAALHALACAAAIDVRTMGVLLVALTVGFAGLEAWLRPALRRRLAGGLLLFVPVLAAATVLGWPYLWENPAGHFLAAFQRFSRYPSDMLTLYLGQEISVRNLPWHYAPVWLLVTTPLPYTALFLTGLAVVVAAVWRGPIRWLASPVGRTDLLLLAWFFGPLLAVIVLRSVMYDGWRHLYFIYPALLLLAGRGLQAARNGWQHAARPLVRRAGYVAAVLLAFGLGPHSYGAWWPIIPTKTCTSACCPARGPSSCSSVITGGFPATKGLAWIMAHDSSCDRTRELPMRGRGWCCTTPSCCCRPPTRNRLRMVSPAAGPLLSSRCTAGTRGPTPLRWGGQCTCAG